MKDSDSLECALSAADVIRVARFLASHPDVGESCRTMASIVIGGTKARLTAPGDRNDFGPCKALVDAVPAIRHHFPMIAERAPEFDVILEHWDELADLLEKERAMEIEPRSFRNRLREIKLASVAPEESAALPASP